MWSGLCQHSGMDLDRTFVSRAENTCLGRQLTLFIRFSGLAVLGFPQGVVQLATVRSQVLAVK